MKKKFTSLFALLLAVAMIIGSVPAMAADEAYANIFNSSSQAYGTGIEYIDELGLYVAGGRGFYTSPDGVNWTLRGGGLAELKNENYGFAYGGPEGSEYFLLILNSSNSAIKNKTFVIDKYFSGRTTVYTYTDSGEVLLLKGVLEWDKYTNKFWCGAALEDGTNAGLYYSEGYKWNAETGKTEMIWTKADVGESALYAEDTAYTAKPATMSPVLTSITSDEQGHIVAYGLWAGSLKDSDAAYSLLNGAGGRTSQSALLVNADSSAVNTQLCDFSGYALGTAGVGISTAVIDKKSNIFIQDTNTWKILAFYTGTFSKLWALGNNGKATTYSSKTNTGEMTAIKYAVNPYNYSDSQTDAARCVHSANRTNTLNKVLSFDDKALLIPRAGQGIGGNNSISDIFVVTYKADGTPAGRYTPFINNTQTAEKAIGDYVNNGIITYVTDAAAGPNGQAVLMTGKDIKNVGTVQNYSTTVTVLETANTVTDSTATELPDRSANVKFANTTECDYTYSHVKAAQNVINVRPGSEFILSAQAYDGTAVNTAVDADISYKAASVPDGFDGADINSGLLYVWDDCSPGSYRIEAEIYITSIPSIKNKVTYTVKVIGDFTSSLNGVYNYDAVCAADMQGLVAGANAITAGCNIEAADDTGLAIIAVYKGNELIKCSCDIGKSTALDLVIDSEEDAGAYSYKIMFWTQDMKPL